MSQSYKSIFFFTILFAILLFGYFNYELFNRYIPVNTTIKIFLLIIGICGIFFPDIIKMLREGYDMKDIQYFIVQKYGKK
jgi:hypothetical protein